MKKAFRLAALVLSILLLANAVSFPVNAREEDTERRSVAEDYSCILTDSEWQVLTLTNRERAAYGLDPLTAFSQLQSACDIREKEILVFFDHTRPNGSPWKTVLKDIGITYQYAGENIAWGFNDTSEVVAAWMNSPGHRANILKKEYLHMGVGASGSGWFDYTWVQMFFTAFDEVYTSCEIVTPSDWSFLKKGTSIDDMGMYAVLESNQCGTCYLPIISEYVSGYDPNQTDSQSVTIKILGFEKKIMIGSSLNGLMEVNGQWGYYSNGVLDTDYNGIMQAPSGTWYYLQNGLIAWDFTGVAQAPSGTWYYIKQGRIAWNFTGIAQAPSGTWYYIKQGRIAWNFTGIAQAPSGTWYYIKQGRIAWSFTGIAQAPSGTWYYIKQGRIAWSYTGLAQATSGRWLYISSGRVAWDYTGTAQAPSGGWCYVRKGAVDWSYTGVVKHSDGNRYYAKNGRVDIVNAEDAPYIGNFNSKIVHTKNCKTIPEAGNCVYFSSYQMALEAGYRFCGSCMKG